jgi:DNA polymerase/3'-5' exonuclease PolX
MYIIFPPWLSVVHSKIMQKISLEVASAIFAELRRALRSSVVKGKLDISVVGSVRRRAPYTKDIDLLITIPDTMASQIDKILPSLYIADSSIRVHSITSAGVKRRSLEISMQKNIVAIDIFITTQSLKPFAMLHHTGSAAYNIRVRTHASKRGWILNQYGVYYRLTRRRVRNSLKIRTEQELVNFIGVSYRPPAGREN